jgi:hypothetical protein
LARLTWDNGLMQLCEVHARCERSSGDVIWIRSLRQMDIDEMPPRGAHLRKVVYSS